MKTRNIIGALLVIALVLIIGNRLLNRVPDGGEGTENTQMEATELKIEVLAGGSGEAAENGDKVSVHYTGWLTNGTKFDSSVDRGQPFEFTLGAGEVIRGWDQGVLGMTVGEKRKLTIPSDLAYGEAGRPPIIPASATLVFEVELVGIE